MYYRSRYYDPSLEAFISQDPMGDAQRYVLGNPLLYTDPLGLYVPGFDLVPSMGSIEYCSAQCKGDVDETIGGDMLGVAVTAGTIPKTKNLGNASRNTSILSKGLRGMLKGTSIERLPAQFRSEFSQRLCTQN